MNVELGLRSRNSFSGIYKWDFRCSAAYIAVLEFFIQWGLETAQARKATYAGRIDSLESILGLLESLKTRAQKNQSRKKIILSGAENS
jgi:hypothetical protein